MNPVRKNLILPVALLLFQLLFAGGLRAETYRSDLYSGLPIGEGVYDLIKNHSAPIATPLNYAKGLERGDTFRLKDNKILYVESKAHKQGDTYSIVRMATFDAKDMATVSVKKLVFFTSFDVEKSVCWNQ